MEWRPEARFWVQSTQKRANFGFKCCAVLSGYGAVMPFEALVGLMRLLQFEALSEFRPITPNSEILMRPSKKIA